MFIKTEIDSVGVEYQGEFVTVLPLKLNESQLLN